jgi:hypothetical protein
MAFLNLRNQVEQNKTMSTMSRSVQRSQFTCPRRSQFDSETAFCAAVQAFEDAFMQRVAMAPPDSGPRFSADDDDDVYFEIDNDTDTETPRRPKPSNRYTALSREELDAELDDCCVCYRPLTRAKSVTTNCLHTFCGSCMTTCLVHTSSCPCCRTEVNSLMRYRAQRRQK